MQKLIFSYIPVEGCVIHPDVIGLLDNPNDAMCLPVYYDEAVHIDRMYHGLAVWIDEGWGSEVFFEPIPKGASQCPDILLLTFCLVALHLYSTPPF